MVGRVACLLVATLIVGCGGSDDATPPLGTAPQMSKIVEATSDVTALQFEVEFDSGGAVVLSSTGVLDVVAMVGYQTDEAGLEGNGLEPVARVWLEGGELFESQDDGPTKPINGGLSNFLGVNDPGASQSVDGVLMAWLDSSTTTLVGDDTIDGVAVRHLLVERQDEEPIELWIDADDRLVKVVEIGTQLRTITTTHRFTYPDDVTIPPRPD
jgi:hypothetical protein